jgi:hypothetical protein
MDILEGFQKLVSTRRTFSISISIGLDVETTNLTIITIYRPFPYQINFEIKVFK